MTKYADHLINVPQSQPLPGRTMVQNAAGGYAFAVDEWKRLRRFLMIGTEGGTYYEGEPTLTRNNADAVMKCIKEDSRNVLDITMEISEGGHAPSNSPAIFVLALVAVYGTPEYRRVAWALTPRVCRTGTHWFEFNEYVRTLRGSLTGRQVKRGIANWYTSRDAKKLAFDVTKYAQRNGWSHRDLIRLGHVHSADAELNRVIGYVAGRVEIRPEENASEAWKYLAAVEGINRATSLDQVLSLISLYNLPREVIPTQWLNTREVWEHLLDKMPYTAMMRNLPKMTKLGMLDAYASTSNTILTRLEDADLIRKNRVHPFAILKALKNYSAGHSFHGDSAWTPQATVTGALERAFRASFGNVLPLDQNVAVFVDVSGSMGAPVNGLPSLRSDEAGAAVALVYAATQPRAKIFAFDTRVREVNINPNGSIRQAMDVFSQFGGGTDISAPYQYALENHMLIDAFLVITDSESWAGERHTSSVFAQYNKAHPSRSVNVQTTASGTTIVDPNMANAMEIAGFSPSGFEIANRFFNGEL